MITIEALNVRQAYVHGLSLLRRDGVREESRAGPVLVMPCPVMTVYTHPCERVLVDPLRDANPFFHLAEALWMLAGRRDADFLNRYVGDFGARFAEPYNKVQGDRGHIHDTYGHRWRKHFGYDQLKYIVKRLRENPQDRQAVLQMWDATPTIAFKQEQLGNYGGANDLRAKDLKTRPCNTHVYFRVRNIAYREPPITDQNSAEWEAKITRGENLLLDMTVCCRSNDMIFGGYGANAVHFSILQEYLAARIGVGVGRYYQLSNNFHAYEDVLNKVWPVGRDGVEAHRGVGLYETGLMPLVANPDTFDDDVLVLVTMINGGFVDHALLPRFECKNPWISHVALPVLHSHAQHKAGNHAAAAYSAAQIKAEDWRRAVVEWLERRKTKREERQTRDV